MMHIITVLLNPADDLQLAALLRSPLFDVTEDDLFAIAHGREGATLWQALFASEVPTAKAAAAENRIRVLMAHEAAGGDGLTGDELEQRTGTPYAVIGPRRPWLVDNEFLVQSGVRLNRRGNREQVFVITDAGRDMAQRLRAEGKAS